jgi:hypothetical protein
MNWKHLLWIIPLVFFISAFLVSLVFIENNENLAKIAFSCYCDAYPINTTYCMEVRAYRENLVDAGLLQVT